MRAPTSSESAPIGTASSRASLSSQSSAEFVTRPPSPSPHHVTPQLTWEALLRILPSVRSSAGGGSADMSHGASAHSVTGGRPHSVSVTVSAHYDNSAASSMGHEQVNAGVVSRQDELNDGVEVSRDTGKCHTRHLPPGWIPGIVNTTVCPSPHHAKPTHTHTHTPFTFGVIVVVDTHDGHTCACLCWSCSIETCIETYIE